MSRGVGGQAGSKGAQGRSLPGREVRKRGWVGWRRAAGKAWEGGRLGGGGGDGEWMGWVARVGRRAKRVRGHGEGVCVCGGRLASRVLKFTGR